MDSDEESDFATISQRDFRRIENKLQKIGYADGVNDGSEKAFQKGFDRGYADGFRTAFALSKYQGFFENLNSHGSEELQKERDTFVGKNIPPAESQEHFQYLKHQAESLEEVSKEQRQYTDRVLAECSESLPLSAQLLQSP